jgi:hypothetical protein
VRIEWVKKKLLNGTLISYSWIMISLTRCIICFRG